MDKDSQELRAELLGSLFTFNRIFFEKRTGREFTISKPDSNESHFITICRELTDVFLLKTPRLMINCPPGWSKTELCKSFIAWCFAWYADCRFLYISHEHELATIHTTSIRQTMTLNLYRHLFGIELRRDTNAKDFFQTTAGGQLAAFGSKGGITGRDAGLPNQDRFTGGIIIDDIHKPDEVHSDTIREKIKRNYHETIEPRLRGTNVPIIIIGQRLHEDDLCAHLLSGADGQEWKHVKICGFDEAGNPRYPEVTPREKLITMQEKQPYVFSSQYMQEPVPAGGGLFKEDWFPLLDKTPEILSTFITADTAETEKTYNDASAFSFWGLYKIQQKYVDVDLYGLHWLNCWEEWFDPKDLEEGFLDFYSDCMRFEVKPKIAAIEKKSSGVTLCSVLKDMQGLKIIDIKRTIQSGTKTDRFLEMQPYIASKLVSLPIHGKHTQLVLKHMSKITANNTHKRDDIADTCYDGVNIALIKKVIKAEDSRRVSREQIAKRVTRTQRTLTQIRTSSYGSRR